MPYPNQHAARIIQPSELDENSFRTKEIAPGITLILGKRKGSDSMETQAYRFDKDKFTAEEAKKWLKDHDVKYIDFEAAKKEISSAISSKPTISEKPIRNGNKLIVPFVKVGTEAFDKNGNRFVLTEEALKNNYKSWEGGRIRVNHDIIENGKIEETWYDNGYVWGVHTGLSNELLSMIHTDAYQGTSQESILVSADEQGNITSVQGTGNSFLFYPVKPACDQNMGCGKTEIVSSKPANCSFQAFTEYFREKLRI